MARRLVATTALTAVALTASVFAQTAPAGRGARPAGGPVRPPLFFSESWKALPTPADDHGAWPAGQAGVASPNLQLTLHGPSGKDIMLVAVRGQRRRLPAQPVDRLHDVAHRCDTARPGQLRRPDRPAREDPLGRAHVRIPSDPAAHQAGRRDVARRRSHDRPLCRLQRADVTIADVRWMPIDAARMVTVGVLGRSSRPEQGRRSRVRRSDARQRARSGRLRERGEDRGVRHARQTLTGFSMDAATRLGRGGSSDPPAQASITIVSPVSPIP